LQKKEGGGRLLWKGRGVWERGARLEGGNVQVVEWAPDTDIETSAKGQPVGRGERDVKGRFQAGGRRRKGTEKKGETVKVACRRKFFH